MEAEPEDREDPDPGADGGADEEGKQEDRRQDAHPRATHRRPKRPCGRASSTAAMTAKMTATEASGQTSATRLWATPRSSPATMEPSRLPSPASATTTKATPSMSTPIHGFSPRIGAVSAPATPASTHPSAKAAVKRRWMAVPSSDTISLSSMPARMMAP